MKKIMFTLTIMLTAAALIAAFSSPATAQVTGVCSNCHTMHNSQGGLGMAFDDTGDTTTTPMPHLTKSSCLGCHITTGNPNEVIGPKVDGAYGTGTARAGGTFKYDAGGTTGPANDNSVHNVWSADVPIPGTPLEEEDTFTGTIPGLSDGMNSGEGSEDPNDLTCAGSSGCHGDALVDGNDAGIGGFHHGSKEGYRFLQIATDQTPVTGLKSPNWELGGADANNHNVYSSSATAGISLLCGNCHPNFHGEANTWDGSTWIRHPTDRDIPNDWTPNITAVYEEHPFAFGDISGKSPGSSYNATDAQVMCLSCHRAHGSPYDDILRWSYSDQNAGSGHDEGCLGCHSKQR